MSTDLITKKQAQELNLQYFFTGVPCKHGHLSQKSVKTGRCRECTRLAHYTYYEKNRDTVLASISEWQKNNKEASRKNTEKWRKNNPENARTAVNRYYETHKELKLSKNKLWREQNKSMSQYYNSKRRAQIKRATVAWADVSKMVSVYEQSEDMTQRTGIQHNVDHIIPLQHPLVCGIHWEGNLQILTAEENQRKGNRF